jgi:hypothetical protein
LGAKDDPFNSNLLNEINALRNFIGGVNLARDFAVRKRRIVT